MATAKLIFNHKKRVTRRSLITSSENFSAVLLLVLLLLAGSWFLRQGNLYDPWERDISQEQLLQSQPKAALYSPPLKLWRDPTSPSPDSQLDIEPFPLHILDSNWQPRGRISLFEPANLYEKINGEAEKFIRQGFRQLHYLVLRSASEGLEIAIELFDHGDIAGSSGIFADHQSDSSRILRSGPVHYFETGVGMIGRKGRYFFRVAADREGEDVKEKVQQLLEAFADLKEDTQDLPLEYRILSDSLNLPAEAISFQAQNVFQLDSVEDFWFAALDPEDKARAFLHRGSSADASKDLYQAILAEQLYDYEIMQELEDLVILRHGFLNTFFIMQRTGAFILGMENLTEEEGGEDVMAMLLEGIDESSG
ncbi:MAG: hypothetical protein QGH75_12965 [Pseudomonadales bacterium]|nr:hypothetical protein [Pseudomonadales bacterium]